MQSPTIPLTRFPARVLFPRPSPRARTCEPRIKPQLSDHDFVPMTMQSQASRLAPRRTAALYQRIAPERTETRVARTFCSNCGIDSRSALSVGQSFWNFGTSARPQRPIPPRSTASHVVRSATKSSARSTIRGSSSRSSFWSGITSISRSVSIRCAGPATATSCFSASVASSEYGCATAV